MTLLERRNTHRHKVTWIKRSTKPLTAGCWEGIGTSHSADDLFSHRRSICDSALFQRIGERPCGEGAIERHSCGQGESQKNEHQAGQLRPDPDRFAIARAPSIDNSSPPMREQAGHWRTRMSCSAGAVLFHGEQHAYPAEHPATDREIQTLVCAAPGDHDTPVARHRLEIAQSLFRAVPIVRSTHSMISIRAVQTRRHPVAARG